MYTRVLLGNLNLTRLIFSKDYGISGSHLDPIARQFIWHKGEDYRHATGHGVGYFLNVHEGPHYIGISRDNPPMCHGRIVSNEPGFYLPGKFGIRIEDVIVCLENKENDTLYFENFTMVPYDRNLLEMNLISNDVREYINQYHKKVFNNLEPFLKNDELAMNYLIRTTKEI
jgi:Xaa-Pro aminopeptidase